MKRQMITLTEDNYKQYLPIRAIAFSYAEGGAMGSPNEVIIVDVHKKLYRFYVHDIALEAINEIVPALRKCQFVFWGEPLEAAPGWNSVYLGFGNHLLVADEIYATFAERRAPYGNNLGKLYQEWIDIVGDIVANK